ncbi:hypothetical protein HZA43_06005 [Candidatus Peregrinibacteria bacterium]|nr:hypothetical protein [Candidatus Peregrinibacteria bacterium]
MPELKDFEGFDAAFADAVVGVDTLFGGNVGSESGGDHFIADTYPTTEATLPPSYHDPRAQTLRERGGAQAGQDAELVEKYIKDYGPLEVRGHLLEALGSGAPASRRDFVDHMGGGPGSHGANSASDQ